MNFRLQRKGAAAILLLLLIVPLIGLLAFSVDYGFLLFVRTDLQRVADQAAMAGARDLVPDESGSQDLDAVRARVREYVELNYDSNFTVLDEDIEIGRYDPDTIYSSLTLLNDGTLDTVRVTLRRESLANQSVSVYFARLLGNDSADIAATSAAALQKGRYLSPGTGVFPFAVDSTMWNGVIEGEEFSIYGDGRVEDAGGNTIPGNYGTVDIGPTNNSTADLRDQINNGLSQNDLDSLQSQGAIPSNEYIDSQQESLILNADPGFSAGIRSAVENVHGQFKLIPIYGPLGGISQNRPSRSSFVMAGYRNGGSARAKSSNVRFILTGNGNGNGNGNSGNGNSGGGTNGGGTNGGGTNGGSGNNLNYQIIGWGAVQVVGSTWNGSQNSSITVKRTSIYDGSINPNPDLSDQGGGIEGVYSAPTLIQ